MSATNAQVTPRIAIIGSGFSGLCLGAHLKKAGIASFTILEKANRVGGTWRDNTYPGAACDLRAFAYCFSFAQKTDWSRKWPPQPEILEYMEACARRFDLMRHIRFDSEVTAASFDADAGVWRLRTGNGDEIEADILVSGVGQLHRPYVPNIPGLETFAGESFHSARWNHAYDLHGKTVAVVGNAASAIQFIPEIAKEVQTLYVFQRSANWIMPRGDRPYRAWEKALLRFPPIARLNRWFIWAQHELGYAMIVKPGSFLGRRMALRARAFIDAQVADPTLREMLVPDYPFGGKRALISDDYYPALNRANVRVVTDGIDHITRDAIVTKDETVRSVDAFIFATGFDTHNFLAPMRITGLDGRVLGEVWKDGAEAYLGITVPGFPNLFLMYGPNTNLGHNSIIFMIECQTRYIMDALRQMRRDGLAFIDVRPEVMAAFNRKIQTELAHTTWALTDHSWYKTADNRITNNWPGTTIAYWWRTRRCDLDDYRHARHPSAAAPQTSRAA